MASILKCVPEFDGEVQSCSAGTEESLNCQCVLRLALTSDDEVDSWKNLFEQRTKTQWIVQNNSSGNSAKRNPVAFIVNRDYVCHQSNARKVKSSKKACGCGAALKIRVRRRSRFVHYRDSYAKRGLYCVITLNNVHNHETESCESMRWLKRSDETTDKFLSYFNEGKSPSEALQLHQDLLKVEDASRLADRSVNPPQKWVYRLYQRWRKKLCGAKVTSDCLRDGEESHSEDSFSEISETCDVKLEKFEPEELSVGLYAENENLMTQSPPSENSLSEGCESESNTKCEDNISLLQYIKQESPTEPSFQTTDVRMDLEDQLLDTVSEDVMQDLSRESGSKTDDVECSDVNATSSSQCLDNSDKHSVCPQCKKTFSDLKRHMRHVHADKLYHCDQCDYRSNFMRSFQSHVSMVHLQEKRFKCPQCDSRFSCRSHLTRHISSVHDQEKPFECSECDKRFSRRHDRDVHFKSIHCGEKPFSCDQCDYKCSERSRLTKHQSAVHDVIRSYPCTLCEHKSETRSSLNQHWIAVHKQQKSYSCGECGKAFYKPSDLKVHVDAVHKRIKPYSCTECDSKFTSKHLMQKHIEAMHRIQ